MKKTITYLLMLTFSFLLFLLIEDANAAVVDVCSSGCNSTSVQTGINLASNGDEVRITDSREYNETVTANKSVLLTSNNTTWPTVFFDGSSNTVTITANNTTISRLMLKYNGTSASMAVISATSKSNITIANNIINNTGSGNTGYGVLFDTTNSSNVINNTIYTNGGNYNYGIYSNKNAQSNNFSNNVINTNGTDSNYGVYSNSGSGVNNTLNFAITNNVINADGSGCCNTGIYNFAKNSTIVSNIITTNGDGGYNYGINDGSRGDDIIAYNSISTRGNNQNNYGILNEAESSINITGNIVSTNGTINSYGIYTAASYGAFVTNNIVSTNGSGSDNYGVYFTTQHDTIINNTITTNGTSLNVGILIGGDSSAIVNNTISARGTGTGNSGIDDRGYFSNISNNIISAYGTGNSYGIYIGGDYANYSSNNITTAGGTTNYGIYFDYIKGSFINDTAINASGSPDIFAANSGGDNYLVNSTFNESDINIPTDSTGKIFVQHRIAIRVVDSNGNPVNNTTIVGNDTSSVADSENPAGSSFSGTTNSSGYISQQLLTQFLGNRSKNATSGYLYFTPYTITANKTGYDDYSTQFNFSSSQLLTITLTTSSSGGTSTSTGGGETTAKKAKTFIIPANVSESKNTVSVGDSIVVDFGIPKGNNVSETYTINVLSIDGGSVTFEIK